MKLLGTAFFLLALCCVFAVGEDGIPASTTSTTTSASTSKSGTEGVNAFTSQAMTLQAAVLTTASRATTESITSNPTLSTSNATQQITQGTTTQPPVKVTTTAEDRSDKTTSTTQANATQLAQNKTLDASSTTGWLFSSTISLQKTTSATRTSGLHVSPTPEATTAGSVGNSSGNKEVTETAIHYSSVILPIVITLIVITLCVFSLVALYRMCQKKTPAAKKLTNSCANTISQSERQENGTEQAQSDKEGVKLLSVKATSPENVFVEVRDIYEVGFSLPSANLYEPTAPPPSGEVSQGRTAGEHSSQGKNKTRQLFTPQQ